jgi:hypothetical protein
VVSLTSLFPTNLDLECYIIPQVRLYFLITTYITERCLKFGLVTLFCYVHWAKNNGEGMGPLTVTDTAGPGLNIIQCDVKLTGTANNKVINRWSALA